MILVTITISTMAYTGLHRGGLREWEITDRRGLMAIFTMFLVVQASNSIPHIQQHRCVPRVASVALHMLAATRRSRRHLRGRCARRRRRRFAGRHERKESSLRRFLPTWVGIGPSTEATCSHATGGLGLGHVATWAIDASIVMVAEWHTPGFQLSQQQQQPPRWQLEVGNY
jgi:hypothetical protein